MYVVLVETVSPHVLLDTMQQTPAVVIISWIKMQAQKVSQEKRVVFEFFNTKMATKSRKLKR